MTTTTSTSPAQPAPADVISTVLGSIANAIGPITTAIAAGGTNIGADVVAAEDLAGSIFKGLGDGGSQIFAEASQILPFAEGILASIFHLNNGTTPATAAAAAPSAPKSGS